VLANFLANAIKFTREGVITIVCRREGDQAAVSVRDTGTGIDNDIMPRLFTKFATKSDRGTGLGLYISRNIIEEHGGKIWAKNNEGKGATFAFKLPIVSDQT
jgi:signal transduction histidine kinase